MFQQAVIRLTLWYVAVIMLLSAFFSVALYQVSTSELDSLQHRQEEIGKARPAYLLPPGFKEWNQERIQEIEDSKHTIAVNLLDFNVIILLLAGAVSYFLAARTLQPIEEAHEAQKRFTADASHELRTPLTSMKTEVEVALRDKNLTLKDSKGLLKSTLEEVGKLEALANGLLALAKQENRGQITQEQCPLGVIIKDAVERVHKQADQKKITLTSSIADTKLRGDCWALTQTVAILLDNAIKYSPAGSEIIVQGKAQGKHVIITVKDQGGGISQTDISHIFDRFYRADTSRSKLTVQGHGLGLSIAKKIVDAHKGSIEVKSQEGKGSTFTIVLPRD